MSIAAGNDTIYEKCRAYSIRIKLIHKFGEYEFSVLHVRVLVLVILLDESIGVEIASVRCKNLTYVIPFQIEENKQIWIK